MGINLLKLELEEIESLMPKAIQNLMLTQFEAAQLKKELDLFPPLEGMSREVRCGRD